MQTCAVFAAYSSWLSRELEKADPDLSGTTKPPNMTDQQWKAFQAVKAQRLAAGGGSAAGSSSSASHADSTSSAGPDGDARIGNLVEIIRKWEYSFSRHLQIMLDALNHYAATETVVLLSLCARLSTANQGSEYAGLRHDDDVEA